MYDLLVRGGRVLDPGEGLDGRLDIAITGGTIAKVGPDLGGESARVVIDASGARRLVVPGLIDVHAHVARGATTAGVGMACVDPDIAGVQGGVTTVADAGSVGIAAFGAIPEHVLPAARTRVRVLLNVGTYAHSIAALPDVNRFEEIDPAGIGAVIAAYPGVISGLKLRLVGPLVKEDGERLVSLAKSTARAHGLPLMVHIGNGVGAGDAVRAREVTRHLLRELDPGDILTHVWTPGIGNVLGDDRAPLAELREARARGAFIDGALGNSNFAFSVVRALADAGFHADTFGSDLTEGSRRAGVFSLLHCVARLRAAGYGLPDVVRMLTVNAARVLGLSDSIGAIRVGHQADLTILDEVGGRWRFTDTLKEAVIGDHAYVPVQTVKAGVAYSPYWGPSVQGWLPEEAGRSA